MRRALSRIAASLTLPMLTIAVLAGGCADDGVPEPGAASSTTSSTAVVESSTMPEISAIAALGYPRDLLDRGRVNVRLARAGDDPFVLLDHRLVIDGFEPAPIEQRRVVIPVDGQVVAVQAVFGDVVECDTPTPLAAHLDVHYTFGDDPEPRAGTIELDDTATLADIRERFCTARRVLAENDVVLGEPALDGETFALDLTIRRRDGDAELTVEAIQGTVLFGAESPFEQGAPERTLAPGVDRLVLPLVFDVNRCDPHAVAETTRKKGLTLWIAVDGATAQPVGVDITDIEDDLEVVLDRCKARTGS